MIGKFRLVAMLALCLWGGALAAAPLDAVARDQGGGREVRLPQLSAKARAPKGERIASAKTWHVLWRVDKWDKTADFRAGKRPSAVVEKHDNLLLNDGITAMLTLLTGGATYPAYNAANSYIWVGDSATAAAASQTAMQAVTNKLAKAMDSTYPTVSAQTVTWKSSYTSAEANYAWNETGVSNGSTLSSTVRMLNRKVTSFGTKASGSTWTMTVTITIS